MDVPRLLLHLFFKLPITQLAHTLLLLSFLCSAVKTGYMHAPFLFMSISLNTHLHAPILQFCYINVSECVGFLINAGKDKQLFTILGSRFSTSWGWKTVMRASVLTALLLSFCPTISVTSSGLSSKWLMSDWHSPRMALVINTRDSHWLKPLQTTESKH